MLTPIPDRLSELVARDWTLRSVCLHDCVGEMEEEVGGGGGGLCTCKLLQAQGVRTEIRPRSSWGGGGGVKGRSNGIISEERRKQHLTSALTFQRGRSQDGKRKQSYR